MNIPDEIRQLDEKGISRLIVGRIWLTRDIFWLELKSRTRGRKMDSMNQAVLLLLSDISRFSAALAKLYDEAGLRDNAVAFDLAADHCRHASNKFKEGIGNEKP